MKKESKKTILLFLIIISIFLILLTPLVSAGLFSDIGELFKKIFGYEKEKIKGRAGELYTTSGTNYGYEGYGYRECGNGIRESGEQCDLGDLNDNAPDTCRLDCTSPRCGDGIVDVLSGESCDDGNNVARDGCSASCVIECSNDKECNDGRFCTVDKCNTNTGLCGYQPKSCSEGDVCTTDYCDEVTDSCKHSPKCNDGNPCTKDICDANTGICTYLSLRNIPIEQKGCDDGNPCTLNLCDLKTGCYWNKKCDDGLDCTDDSCNTETGICTNTNTCDDKNPCTNNRCYKKTGCVFKQIPCGDKNSCTGPDSCNKLTGKCENPVLEGKFCNDGEDCTIGDKCVDFGGAGFCAGPWCENCIDRFGMPCSGRGGRNPVGDPPCFPNCAGKNCGSDGCGGTCGTCSAGKWCSLQGTCESCEPSCAGKDCGPDGCGGSCGTCIGGETCGNGLCGPNEDFQGDGDDKSSKEGEPCEDDSNCGTGETCDNEVCAPEETCTSECSGKECGDDGCGGSCGNCNAGETCENGQCVPEKAPCPNDFFCDPGESCDDGECEPTCPFNKNCDTGEICKNGVCMIPCTNNAQCQGVVEECVNGVCKKIEGKCLKNEDCYDWIGCTRDSCNIEINECDYNPDDSLCRSGSVCHEKIGCIETSCTDCGACDIIFGIGCSYDECSSKCVDDEGGLCYFQDSLLGGSCEDLDDVCDSDISSCGDYSQEVCSGDPCEKSPSGCMKQGEICVENPVCGNGNCEQGKGETCGNCPEDCPFKCSSPEDCNDGNSCTADTCQYPGTCNARCLYIPIEPSESTNDLCCPEGSVGSGVGADKGPHDVDCSENCGDGECKIEEEESCDTCATDCGCGPGYICNAETKNCEVCQPNCDGKECGSDSCGGTCEPGCSGDTPYCDSNGRCVNCIPDCIGKKCGWDGCSYKDDEKVVPDLAACGGECNLDCKEYDNPPLHNGKFQECCGDNYCRDNVALRTLTSYYGDAYDYFSFCYNKDGKELIYNLFDFYSPNQPTNYITCEEGVCGYEECPLCWNHNYQSNKVVAECTEKCEGGNRILMGITNRAQTHLTVHRPTSAYCTCANVGECEVCSDTPGISKVTITKYPESNEPITEEHFRDNYHYCGEFRESWFCPLFEDWYNGFYGDFFDHIDYTNDKPYNVILKVYTYGGDGEDIITGIRGIIDNPVYPGETIKLIFGLRSRDRDINEVGIKADVLWSEGEESKSETIKLVQISSEALRTYEQQEIWHVPISGSVDSKYDRIRFGCDDGDPSTGFDRCNQGVCKGITLCARQCDVNINEKLFSYNGLRNFDLYFIEKDDEYYDYIVWYYEYPPLQTKTAELTLSIDGNLADVITLLDSELNPLLDPKKIIIDYSGYDRNINFKIKAERAGIAKIIADVEFKDSEGNVLLAISDKLIKEILLSETSPTSIYTSCVGKTGGNCHTGNPCEVGQCVKGECKNLGSKECIIRTNEELYKVTVNYKNEEPDKPVLDYFVKKGEGFTDFINFPNENSVSVISNPFVEGDILKYIRELSIGNDEKIIIINPGKSENISFTILPEDITEKISGEIKLDIKDTRGCYKCDECGNGLLELCNTNEECESLGPCIPENRLLGLLKYCNPSPNFCDGGVKEEKTLASISVEKYVHEGDPTCLAKTGRPVIESVQQQCKLLDFYADWCWSCKDTNPVIDELIQVGYSIQKVNVDKDTDNIAGKFNIKNLPTFVIVSLDKEGKETEIGRITGTTTKQDLMELFEKCSSKISFENSCNDGDLSTDDQCNQGNCQGIPKKCPPCQKYGEYNYTITFTESNSRRPKNYDWNKNEGDVIEKIVKYLNKIPFSNKIDVSLYAVYDLGSGNFKKIKISNDFTIDFGEQEKIKLILNINEDIKNLININLSGQVLDINGTVYPLEEALFDVKIIEHQYYERFICGPDKNQEGDLHKIISIDNILFNEDFCTEEYGICYDGLLDPDRCTEETKDKTCKSCEKCVYEQTSDTIGKCVGDPEKEDLVYGESENNEFPCLGGSCSICLGGDCNEETCEGECFSQFGLTNIFKCEKGMCSNQPNCALCPGEDCPFADHYAGSEKRCIDGCDDVPECYGMLNIYINNDQGELYQIRGEEQNSKDLKILNKLEQQASFLVEQDKFDEAIGVFDMFYSSNKTIQLLKEYMILEIKMSRLHTFEQGSEESINECIDVGGKILELHSLYGKIEDPSIRIRSYFMRGYCSIVLSNHLPSFRETHLKNAEQSYYKIIDESTEPEIESDAYVGIALVYRERGNIARTLVELQEAIKLDSDNEKALETKMQIQKNILEMIKDWILRQQLKIHEEMIKETSGWTCYWRGVCYYSGGIFGIKSPEQLEQKSLGKIQELERARTGINLMLTALEDEYYFNSNILMDLGLGDNVKKANLIKDITGIEDDSFIRKYRYGLNSAFALAPGDAALLAGNGNFVIGLDIIRNTNYPVNSLNTPGTRFGFENGRGYDDILIENQWSTFLGKNLNGVMLALMIIPGAPVIKVGQTAEKISVAALIGQKAKKVWGVGKLAQGVCKVKAGIAGTTAVRTMVEYAPRTTKVLAFIFGEAGENLAGYVVDKFAPGTAFITEIFVGHTQVFDFIDDLTVIPRREMTDFLLEGVKDGTGKVINVGEIAGEISVNPGKLDNALTKLRQKASEGDGVVEIAGQEPGEHIFDVKVKKNDGTFAYRRFVVHDGNIPKRFNIRIDAGEANALEEMFSSLVKKEHLKLTDAEILRILSGDYSGYEEVLFQADIYLEEGILGTAVRNSELLGRDISVDEIKRQIIFAHMSGNKLDVTDSVERITRMRVKRQQVTSLTDDEFRGLCERNVLGPVKAVDEAELEKLQDTVREELTIAMKRLENKNDLDIIGRHNAGADTLSEAKIRDLEEKFIKRNEALIASIARGIYNHKRGLVGSRAGIDDFVSAGRWGALEALRRWDSSKNVEFSTYAAYWIRNKIDREVIDPLISFHIPQNLRGKMASEINEFVNKKGGKVTREEIKEFVKDLDPELNDNQATNQVEAYFASRESKKLSGYVDREGKEIPQRDPKADCPVDQAYKGEAWDLLDSDLLSPQEKEALKYYYGMYKGRSAAVDDIASQTGITPEKASQLIDSFEAETITLDEFATELGVSKRRANLFLGLSSGRSLTPTEIGSRLGVSKQKVDNLINSGRRTLKFNARYKPRIKEFVDDGCLGDKAGNIYKLYYGLTPYSKRYSLSEIANLYGEDVESIRRTFNLGITRVGKYTKDIELSPKYRGEDVEL